MAPQQISWLGLGNMGRGMCKNLVQKGNLPAPLIIYNRTTKRAEDLSEALGPGKSIVAKNIEDAILPADLIFMCMGNDEAVRETIGALLKFDVSGKLIVDCSTIHPSTTRELSEALAGQGAAFVACPVFGAPAMADSGQLICVLAGPSHDVEKVRPFCKGVMGRANIDFSGQDPEKALVLKLIGNTMILAMVESLAEGHTMAEKTGLGTDELHKFIDVMFPGPYVAYSSRMMSGSYYNRDEPLFHVDLALKDVGHALSLASNAGAKMRTTEVVQQHLRDVKAYAGDKGDLAGIYGAVRLESGLKYEN